MVTPAQPTWIIAMGAAFIACSTHFGSAAGSVWLKRLGIVHLIVGCVYAVLVIPAMVSYIDYISGNLRFGRSWFDSVRGWATAIQEWFWILPIALLPALLALLANAVRRAAEARKAGM
ncbi:MAG: hypothetical protein QM783_06475 [Phycisphaerales bacterium]